MTTKSHKILLYAFAVSMAATYFVLLYLIGEEVVSLATINSDSEFKHYLKNLVSYNVALFGLFFFPGVTFSIVSIFYIKSIRSGSVRSYPFEFLSIIIAVVTVFTFYILMNL